MPKTLRCISKNKAEITFRVYPSEKEYRAKEGDLFENIPDNEADQLLRSHFFKVEGDEPKLNVEEVGPFPLIDRQREAKRMRDRDAGKM